MAWDEISGSACQIAQALSVVGDRWTLLIMRELSLGVRRFEGIQAQTGMSSHLLSARLKRLEHEGVIERRLYSVSRARYEYHATAKGKELDAVLLALREWGMKWGSFEPGDNNRGQSAPTLAEEAEPGLCETQPSCEKAAAELAENSLSDAFRAERKARLAAFRNSKLRSITRRN